ncbi:MAG: glutathione S-transferase N-terminal domain-containing protein [Nitrospirae bacterium]|nr:glutathione S-transferase N-terminal domain-containing protein [Nitrospirota bacterium]
MMRLYQTEWCPYCRRVRMKLTELGITYVTVNVQREKSLRTDLLAVSGQPGIPTLVDRDVLIADDDEAIIAYLEARYGTSDPGSGEGPALEHASAAGVLRRHGSVYLNG